MSQRANEEHVAGAVLLQPECLEQLRDLTQEHFEDAALGAVLRVSRELKASGKAVDLDTVATRLDGQLEALGGRSGLARLRDNTATVETVRLYADALVEAALARGIGSLPDEVYADEPRATADAAAAGPKPNGKASKIEPFPVHRLDEVSVSMRRAVVQGIGLDEAAVAAIVGSPNAGKTAFAVSLALAVAGRAERWLGLKVAGGPVVYFAPEAPASVKMRAQAGVSRMNPPRAGAFYICQEVPAIGGELTAAMDAQRMIATVQAVSSAEGERVCLVFIDTLASCLGDGDENGEGMLRLVAAAKLLAASTGACVVLIHHPSKGDGAALRGHGSLSAACDSVLRIESEELTGVRVATLTKARDHATGLQLRFELEPLTLPERDSFGDAVTTIVVKPTDQASPRPRPSGQRQRELLTELERRYRTGERSWDEATVCKAGRDLGMHRNSPRDALRGLVKSGYLVGSSMSLSLKYPPEEPK